MLAAPVQSPSERDGHRGIGDRAAERDRDRRINGSEASRVLRPGQPPARPRDRCRFGVVNAGNPVIGDHRIDNPSATTESSTVETTTSNSAPAPVTVVQTVVPATPPAAVQSGIGRGTVLIALAVLLIALAVVVLAVRRWPDTSTVRPGAAPTRPSTERGQPGRTADHRQAAPSATSGDSVGSAGWSSPIDGSSLHELMAFMVDLGDTMVDSGDPVTHVGDCLRRVAEVNGARGAEIIVLPTALIITLPGMGEARTEVASTGGSRLRLDQVEAVFTVADAAERGELGPRAALVEVRSARDLPPSYGPGVIVAGHAVIAMGLAIILAGGWTDIAVAAVLGAGVGVIKQLAARRRLAIQVFLPVLCAVLVAAAVALLGRTG